MASRKKPRIRFPNHPYHIIFRGEIHPPASKVTLSGPIEIKYEEPEGYSVISYTSITNCRLTVDCYLKYLIDDYMTVTLVRIGDAARAIIDLIAFSKGLGVQVVFDHWVDHDQRHRPILFADPALAPLTTSFSAAAISSELLQLVMSDNGIFLALNDLIMANTMPHQTAASCGRVVEGIRHLIAGKGMEAKKAWPLMHKALRVEKSFLDLITDNAMHYRHGNRVFIPGPDNQAIVHRTWQVMDRYFHLRLRNLTELPAVEFPLLTGS